MREGRTAEASAAHKEIAQLQSALAAEMFAKDAATARSKEVEQLLSAEMATRAAADGKVSALEKDHACYVAPGGRVNVSSLDATATNSEKSVYRTLLFTQEVVIYVRNSL